MRCPFATIFIRFPWGTTMINIFLKYINLYFCGLYASSKISNSSNKNVLLPLEAFLLAVSQTFVNQYLPKHLFFLPFCGYIMLISLNIKNSAFVYSILSITLSLSIFTSLHFLVSALLSLIFDISTVQLAKPVLLILLAVTPPTTVCLLSVKRLKSGMTFLASTPKINLGITISSFTIFLWLLVHNSSADEYILSSIAQLAICLLLIPFIAWWRTQLTKSYQRYLRQMEVQMLKTQVAQLTEDNQRLTQIVHKDNKLVTAMASSVLEFVEQTPRLSPEELSRHSESMHRDLLSLSEHRQEALQQLSGTVTGQFHTGHMIVDSILHFGQKQAREHDISLAVNVDMEFWNSIFSEIDEEQLSHILADLIQNAIIATKSCQKREIIVSLASVDAKPSIGISDSGVDFPCVVLDKLGFEKCSQHLSEGGSGIGLMDIWQLKKNAKATLLIEEFEDDATFTKQITLIFDKKDRYLVLSPRKKEIQDAVHRTDILICDKDYRI